jgi:hypothetical protein
LLNIAGLVMHSSCTVRSFSVQKRSDAVRVMFVIGIAMPGESGTFDINVAFAELTRRVYLGNDETPISQLRHTAFEAASMVGASA